MTCIYAILARLYNCTRLMARWYKIVTAVPLEWPECGKSALLSNSQAVSLSLISDRSVRRQMATVGQNIRFYLGEGCEMSAECLDKQIPAVMPFATA